MDIMRNFIHVIGITPEEELPNKINGQVIQYSDVETIYIPENKPAAKNIFEVQVQVEITSSRLISTPLFRTIIIDGIKKYKIIYTSNDSSDSANFFVVNTPYNTFIELPDNCRNRDNAKVYIMDAYFDLLDDKRIYSYILYLVHAPYDEKNVTGEIKKSPIIYEAADEIMITGGHHDDMYYDNMPMETSIELEESLIDIESEYL